MPLFTINQERCKADGLCVRACPASLVRQAGPGTFPEPLPDREGHCIRCGHCVAACPTGAFIHSLFPPDAFEPLRWAALPGFEAVTHLMKARRSCRNYMPSPLSREELAALFAAVRYAPTGHNTRSVKFLVVEGPERMAEVRLGVVEWMREEVSARTPFAATLHLAGAIRAVGKGKDVVFRGAPHVAVAYAPKDGLTPVLDAAIATSWLEIAAAAKGLGACWCGYLIFALAANRRVADMLGIPEDHQGFAAMLLGRPSQRPVSIPPREGLVVRFF